MTQPKNRIFVVGDTFAGTAAQFDNIMTETDALDHVLSNPNPKQQTMFLVQQGVDYRSIDSAVRSLTKDTTSNGFYVVSPSQCGARATKRFAHKARSENIVISMPRQLDDRRFEMDLCFSSQNEFFLDHMTGMHIQGMALIEAGRQAFLAVTEAFFLNGDSKSYYFVTKSMDTSFQNFVFPFDATLVYEVTKVRQKGTYLGIEATITVEQGGVSCATIEVAFTAFEADKIATKEREVAQVCLDALSASYDARTRSLEHVA